MVDRVKVATFMGTDRPHVLRQAIHCCRNFGTVSIVGVYGGFLDKIPMGSAINRGLTFRMAQTPVQHYLPMLLERIEKGEIDPSFVITHRASLEDGPGALQDLPRQEGRLHQGRPEALTSEENRHGIRDRANSPSSPAPRPASASSWPRSAPSNGFDLLIAADEPEIETRGRRACARPARTVEAVEADLATLEGVDQLYAAIERPAGRRAARQCRPRPRARLPRSGLRRRARSVIDTNVTGTIYLMQKVGRDMRARGSGRILITGSIAGFMPGTYPGGLQRHQGVPRLLLLRAARTS